jgi:ubiquinone/menaquinone biosynthesis C-methylase UbiE
MSKNVNEIELQRTYYSETAKEYDSMHFDEKGIHFLALMFLASSLEYFEINSILDIGSGTGRVPRYLKQLYPHLKIVGIEPVEELRKIGYANGLSPDELLEGDATNLSFLNQEFDLVCEFGALHHIKNPEPAVSEMLRVSKKAIFISDSNNFGQGSLMTRSMKQFINLLGCWKIFDLLKTGGKGFTISEGDGLSYSYSVFNNYQQIKKQCKNIHLLNTADGDIDFYKTASHIALLGVKK